MKLTFRQPTNYHQILISVGNDQLPTHSLEIWEHRQRLKREEKKDEMLDK